MYHTDLGQNAVFQKIQDKLHYIQDNQSWPFSEISKITHTASRFSLLTSAKFAKFPKEG